MSSSAVAGMVFLPSQELCQMVKPMTEIELNEKIESLLNESATRQPSRRTGTAYRKELRTQKNDARMCAISQHYTPCGPYVSGEFDGKTLLHSGYYIKYPRNSHMKRALKRMTSKRWRHIAADCRCNGMQYKRLLDYWWIMD